MQFSLKEQPPQGEINGSLQTSKSSTDSSSATPKVEANELKSDLTVTAKADVPTAVQEKLQVDLPQRTVSKPLPAVVALTEPIKTKELAKELSKSVSLSCESKNVTSVGTTRADSAKPLVATPEKQQPKLDEVKLPEKRTEQTLKSPAKQVTTSADKTTKSEPVVEHVDKPNAPVKSSMYLSANSILFKL